MRRTLRKTQRSNEDGFTIIELLIATLIFAGIMIVLTLGVIEITRTYYKGITENKTQNAARNVVSDISQALQLSGGAVSPIASTSTSGYSYYCIGSEQFTFTTTGQELTDNSTLGTDQTHNALMLSSSCTGASISPSAGTELLSPSMRLSNFTITPVAGATNLYQVSLQVTYGDDVLLTNPTGPNAACIGGAGDQFCTVSVLNTVVNAQ